MQLVLWMTWCLVLGHVTADENVVFVIGRGRDFVRQACNVIAAETFKFNVADVFEFGQSWVEGCVQSQASGVNMFQFGNESYRISEVLSREEPRGRLDKHTGDLENDVQNTSMAKFYVLHDVSQNEQHFLETLEYVSNFLFNFDKKSISVLLVNGNFSVVDSQGAAYLDSEKTKQQINDQQAQFVKNIETAFSKLKYSYNREIFLNLMTKMNAANVRANLGSLYIPTDAYFLNWARYLFQKPASDFALLNPRKMGFLASNEEKSDIPRIALQNSMRTLYERLVSTKQLEVSDSSIYMPNIDKLTAKLEKAAQTEDFKFCDVLQKQVSVKVLDLCERSEFISYFTGLRSLKYEFANYDLINIFKQCKFNNQIRGDLDSLEVNALYKPRCSVMKDDFTKKSYVFDREHCYAKLSQYEELQLLLKSQPHSWSKNVTVGVCTFTGSLITLNEISTSGCSKTSVVATLAVITNTAVAADIDVVSPLVITTNAKYLPSLLLLERDLEIAVEHNVVRGNFPRTTMMRYLVDMFDPGQCYGTSYQLNMAESLAQKLIYQNVSINLLMQDYKFMFDNVNVKNQLALQVYTDVLLKYYALNLDSFDSDSKAVLIHILLAYNALNVPIKDKLNLVINQESYVAIVNDKIASLQKLKRDRREEVRLQAQIRQINSSTEDYINMLKGKVKECKAVSDNMNQVLNKNMLQYHTMLQNTIKDAEKVQASAGHKVEELKSKRKAMILRMIANVYLTGLKVFGAVATVFVPPLGAGIVAGASLVSGIIDATASEYDTNYQIPSGIFHEFKEIEFIINDSFTQQLTKTKADITNLKSSIAHDSSYDERVKFIEDIEKQVLQIEANRTSDSYSTLLDLKERLDNFGVVSGGRFKRALSTHLATDANKGTGEIITNSLNAVTDGLAKNTELAKDMPSLADIEKAEDDLKKVIEFKDRIFSKVLPFLVTFNQYMGDKANTLHLMSKPLLIEMKFFMKSKFKSIMYEFQAMTSGLQSNSDVSKTADDIQDVLNAIFELNQELQTNEHEQKYIHFLQNVLTPVALPGEVKDKTLLKFMKDMKNDVISINIYHEITKIMEVFMQWVFPFAPEVAHKIQLLDNLNTFKTISSTNIDSYVRAFESLSEFIKKYKNQVLTPMDSFTKEVIFDTNRYTGAFYSWNQTVHAEKINALLSEKEVIFVANIPDTSVRPEQAVKFKSISLQFNCTDAAACGDFDATLKKFVMHMTHLGNSEYRCKDQIFTINTPVQPFEYSFENLNGTSSLANVGRGKLKSGDVILSPYTIWKFRIRPFRPEFKDEMAKYGPHVNLALVGEGTFVTDESNGKEACQPGLEAFYDLKIK